jgi:hypothetical protein
MKEIQIEDLRAAGYREDSSGGRRLEWPYTIAMLLGLAAFAGSMVILDRGSIVWGFGVAGTAWLLMVAVILVRYFSNPRDPQTGEQLEKFRAFPRGLPNEELVLVNHRTKTFIRRVVARRDSCLPPGG